MQHRSDDARRSASREANPIGFALAEARVAGKLSITQVSGITKIRAGLIKEIEYGDFRNCGGDIYARGHIRSIAQAVGADADALVAMFEATHGVPEQAPVPTTMLASDPVAVKEFKEHRGTRWLIPASVAMGVLAVIAGVGLLTGPSNDPAGAPLADSTTAPKAQIPTAAPSSPSPSSESEQSLLAYSGVVISMRVHDQRSWIHVEDNLHKTLFEGIVNAGQTKDFHSTGALHIVLGNAGAVDLTVNGHHLGAPDAFGKIFSFTFAPGDASFTNAG